MDADRWKKEFPIFHHYPDLVYLDSTATTLKPQAVIDALTDYYVRYSANIHRGIYKISEEASSAYESVRDLLAEFIGASDREEIIFTRNTTESINLIAYSLGRQIIGEGDEIVTTIMEHHSNFVPWQMLAAENNAELRIIDITSDGYLTPAVFKGKPSQNPLDGIVTKKTKIIALTAVSNVLGTVNPVRALIKYARAINPAIIAVVDAAQAIQFAPVHVGELDADFIAFSGHKMLGPTGIGVLWGKKHVLNSMYPFQFGGDMIQTVNIQSTSFQNTPHKFEAGTPHIAGVIGLGTAVRFIQSVGLRAIYKHEQELADYAIKRLTETFATRIQILGPKNRKDRSGIVSFTLEGIHPHDAAQILDSHAVAVRAGHHCAMPLHKALGVVASVRASFYLYNTRKDVDRLVSAIGEVFSVFQPKNTKTAQ